MTFHSFSPFSRQNLGLKAKYFYFLIGDLCFLLTHSLKLYSSFSYYSFGLIVIEHFFDIPIKICQHLYFPYHFIEKWSLLHTCLKVKF